MTFTLLLQMVWTHWGQVTGVCLSGSDNGLSRVSVMIWIGAGLLVIDHLRTNFSEISIKMKLFSSKKITLKMSSAKY